MMQPLGRTVVGKCVGKETNIAKERITETRTPNGNTHTNTTIITDQPSSGGGFRRIGLLALIVVAVAAVLVFS